MISGKAPVVNLKNFGIILENGGCGIQNLPIKLTDNTNRNTVISSSVWQNIKVYSSNAHDFDYAYYLHNIINCSFENLCSYGGGGIFIYGKNGSQYGYSTFIKPKIIMWLNCKSDAFRINDSNITDISIFKPIINVFNDINAERAPLSTQYLFYCHINASQIKLYDYNFGSNGSVKLLLPDSNNINLGRIEGNIIDESTIRYQKNIFNTGVKMETGGSVAGTSSQTSGHVTFQSFKTECKTLFIEGNGITITKSNITKDGFDWSLSGDANGTFYWLAFGY
jgi:hypothetical protein